LAALVDEGLLDQDARRRTYTAGHGLLTSAAVVRDMFGLMHAARQSLDRLAELRASGVFLGMRCGNDALCVDVRPASGAPWPARLHANDRWPLGVGAFSMAILAFLPPDEVAKILSANKSRLTRYPELAPDKLRRLVQRTRARGHALARAKSAPRTVGLGVPILDPKRRPVASLCIVLPPELSNAEQRNAMVDAMRVEARIVAELWSKAEADTHFPSW
jgi:DNA-binding IclR family transcriptional regulator